MSDDPEAADCYNISPFEPECFAPSRWLYTGLGALSAYIFTDVPQVLGDNLILLLDPHAMYHKVAQHGGVCSGRYIECRSKSKRRSPLTTCGTSVDEHDPDHVNFVDDAPSIIEPFVAFSENCPAVPKWEAETQYPGTIFRFPLRSLATASGSAISNISISTEDCIDTVLTPFLHSTAELVLFTQYTKNISA